jgi:hypothetical protein
MLGETVGGARRLDDHVTQSRDGVLEDFFAPVDDEGESAAAAPARAGRPGARDRPPPRIPPSVRGNGASGTTRRRMNG